MTRDRPDLISHMQGLVGVLSARPVFNFLWGVLGGETDYPLAIAINALVSMIPVFGLAFDNNNNPTFPERK